MNYMDDSWRRRGMFVETFSDGTWQVISAVNTEVPWWEANGDLMAASPRLRRAAMIAADQIRDSIKNPQWRDVALRVAIAVLEHAVIAAESPNDPELPCEACGSFLTNGLCYNTLCRDHIRRKGERN